MKRSGTTSSSFIHHHRWQRWAEGAGESKEGTEGGVEGGTGGAGGESEESGAHQGPGDGVHNDGSLNIFPSASLAVRYSRGLSHHRARRTHRERGRLDPLRVRGERRSGEARLRVPRPLAGQLRRRPAPCRCRGPARCLPRQLGARGAAAEERVLACSAVRVRYHRHRRRQGARELRRSQLSYQGSARRGRRRRRRGHA